MQTLKLVADTNDVSKINSLIGTETGGIEDKMACMLTYLRSLEHDAEQTHGNNDDWRYGRYLVYAVMIDAMKRAAMQSD